MKNKKLILDNNISIKKYHIIFLSSAVIFSTFLLLLLRPLTVDDILLILFAGGLMIGLGYGAVYVSYKNKTLINEVVLKEKHLFLDVPAENSSKEIKYSDIEKIGYQDGIYNKGVRLESDQYVWFVPGIPKEGQKEVQRFLKLAKKKIKEAKKE